jgi:hypoxanthine-DNA glycosylase
MARGAARGPVVAGRSDTEAPGHLAGELLEGLPPVMDARTRLLVLGSFPGVASLRAQQYYGHPRNHFWPLLSAMWAVDLTAMPYDARLAAFRERGLGLWDVYARCRRQGSLDQAIEDAEFNDFASLRTMAPSLVAVAHNGGESARAMKQLAAMGFQVHRLPSSSPANASWSFSRKLAAWREVFEGFGLAG